MFTKNIVVFDVETTGLNEEEHSVVDLGAVFLRKETFETVDTFSTPKYIRPQTNKFFEAAMEINKIDVKNLFTAPPFNDVMT